MGAPMGQREPRRGTGAGGRRGDEQWGKCQDHMRGAVKWAAAGGQREAGAGDRGEGWGRGRGRGRHQWAAEAKSCGCRTEGWLQGKESS